jgi:hypothetical protein
MKQSKSKVLLGSALAAVFAVAGVVSQVQAEGSSSSAEVQRGVPGVDVDMNASRSGLPNVDLQAGNQNDSDNGVMRTDPDTRTLGAGADTGTTTSSDTSTLGASADTGDSGSQMRAPIQDRN